MLPHCASTAKKKKPDNLKIYKKQIPGSKRRRIVKAEEYRAEIEGVECPVCAQTVVDLVKQIDGVVEASYQKGTQGYEDGVLIFSWDIKKNCEPHFYIEEAIKKEEFEVILLERIEKEK